MVSKGRLVMGLERFFVLIQLSIASLSYEYPSVGTHPPDDSFIRIKEVVKNYGEKVRSALTSSNDGLPHQLSGDWTEELVRDAQTD